MLKLGFIFAAVLVSLPASAIAKSRDADIVAIGAGSSAPVGTYSADKDFSGGSSYSANLSIDTSHVSNPAPAAVYDTCRYGSGFQYTIPQLAAGASYLVRLHFAEIYFNAAGHREFNVKINGVQVLTNFDIFAASGGEGVAVVQEFQATADGSGNITLEFVGVVENAQVNAIEIQRMGSLPIPTPTPSFNLSLSSDRASYRMGDAATVIATLTNVPLNPGQEFYVSATFQGNPIALTAITSTQSYAITPALIAGGNTFTAVVYQENANQAAALNATIQFYQSEIAGYQAQLANTTDPNTIATLNAKIAHDQDRLGATQAELAGIRHLIGAPVNLILSAY